MTGEKLVRALTSRFSGLSSTLSLAGGFVVPKVMAVIAGTARTTKTVRTTKTKIIFILHTEPFLEHTVRYKLRSVGGNQNYDFQGHDSSFATTLHGMAAC